MARLIPGTLLRRSRGISNRRGVFRHTVRSKFIAAAVATCCKCIFASPRYRAHHSPKARTPWERVPSTPARRLYRCCPSSLAYHARAACSASNSACSPAGESTPGYMPSPQRRPALPSWWQLSPADEVGQRVCPFDFGLPVRIRARQAAQRNAILCTTADEPLRVDIGRIHQMLARRQVFCP
jgi:hypothetical protein